MRVNTRVLDFTPTSNSYFIGRASYGESDNIEDPGSVEITQEQMYRDKPFEERTSFNNKIDESIYRTKLHLLRKKGSWD